MSVRLKGGDGSEELRACQHPDVCFSAAETRRHEGVNVNNNQCVLNCASVIIAAYQCCC